MLLRPLTFYPALARALAPQPSVVLLDEPLRP